MQQTLKIGYFKHWHRPPYSFIDFVNENGITVTEIDFGSKNYLEGFDVAIIEQHGFNDYIENDEPYIQDWVKRGGILVFMHQDYQRWVPQFLPHELGDTMLIHRYMQTINGFPGAADPSYTGDKDLYATYLMPWIEDVGKGLFAEPYVITPDEMLHWKVAADTFTITHGTAALAPTTFRTTAKSCFLTPKEGGWKILGSFMDCAVRDGALILQGNYGKGMYFLNQILFPEANPENSDRVLAFWKKYIHNLVAYLTRFKNGAEEPIPAAAPKTLPIKKNYKLAIHMHSLDWYGADSHPGTINAIMRYMNWDICSLAVKDVNPYGGRLSTEKYSDDKVLFLDGQELHPFNWGDCYSDRSHNTYHILAIGIDPDAYTPKYTRSFYGDEEIDAYLKEALSYIHAHGGVACATHPQWDYWKNYDYDAIDKEPAQPMSGTDIEKSWLDGYRFPLMNSVDLYGPRRALDNPAINFIYLKGEAPCRDSVTKAIRNGHTIAAAGFAEADICLNNYVPGDTVPLAEAAQGQLSISAKTIRGPIRQIRVYSGAECICALDGSEDGAVDIKIPLQGMPLNQFIRVEIEGLTSHWICNSTPFYLK